MARERGISVLWIGRMRFAPHVRIREIELARRVARAARVVALDRSDALETASADPPFTTRLRIRWKLAQSGLLELHGDPVTRFRMPVFAATEPILDRIAAALNDRQLEHALSRFGSDSVFHSSPIYFLTPPRSRRSYRCHFDLVDNFFEEWGGTFVGRSRRKFLFESMANADTLSTCTLTLCERVERALGRRPVYIPNGADLDAIRSWPRARAEAVRERLGLERRPVFAYVGNHMARIDGMELLLDAFEEAHHKNPSIALLLVGPGSDRVAGPRRLGPDRGVFIIGPVPTDSVWDYFQAADAGILPVVPRPETHVSMRLRMLEFGAAGKPMLSTPLEELERLALPHVRFVPYERRAWTLAFLDEALREPPDAGRVAASLAPFTWDAAAERLLETLRSGG
jgi:glycosyltransferase involved in cell wall biosynthesis